MKILKTNFKGLYIIKSPIHKDSRGHFKEIFKKTFFKTKICIYLCFFLKKNVLRGMHLQTKFSQGKFLSVLKGEIFDVVVDLEKNSKRFGKHY